MNGFVRRLGWLVTRREKEDELSAELRFHLDEEEDQRRESGMAEAEAKLAARRDFGNAALVKEDTRAAWGWTQAERVMQDLRFAGRLMRRNPGFVVLALISLALGTGANTALYSFMDALLLRRLPVADPGRLIVIDWHMTGRTTSQGTVIHSASGWTHNDPKAGKVGPIFPWPAYELLRGSTDIFTSLFAYREGGEINVAPEGQAADIAQAEYVSGNFFSGLGLAPAAGRLLVEDDDGAAARAVVVLSYAFAHTRFGDPGSAAGRKLTINNVPFTVIGVAPAGFSGVDPAGQPDIFLPLHSDVRVDLQRRMVKQGLAEYGDRHYYWIEMIGRLRPGVTITQAQAALAPTFHGWVADTAESETEAKGLPELLLKPGENGLDNLRRKYSLPLFVLMAMAGLILAIACANIANLLLARSTARRHEMAVRLGMGAGRWRVVRQLLTESLALAAMGGAVGTATALWGIRFLGTLVAESDGITIQAGLNWRVLAAAAVLTTVTGVVFGLAPALEATRIDVMPALKESRTGEERPHGRMRFSFSRLLVLTQLAISLVLLVAAGLFVRTLRALDGIDTGFRPENLLTFSVNARAAGHRDPEIISFYRRIGERLAGIPGARAVTVANSRLIAGEAWGWPVVPAGQEQPKDAPNGHGTMAANACHVLVTGPGFFSAMKIPIVAGREFDDRDLLNTPPVAIVNQAWLRVNLPGANPIGRRVVSFAADEKPVEMEIVGVAKDAKYDQLTDDNPATVYLPYLQNLALPLQEMTYFIRTVGHPLAVSGGVREIMREEDARIPVTNLRTEAGQIAIQMSEQILFARLCTVLALLALAIACVGLYGTMSYSVARRTREIGIRMALGARRGTVLRMVMIDVAVLVAVGLAISMPVALGASRLVKSFLFGVKPGDPVTMAAAAGILTIAAVIAGYIPARRASLTDPMMAVRSE